MNRRLQALVVAAALLGGAASADPGKLYRWTDADGHVHFSDRVPPDAAHQQHEQLDAQGKSVKTVDREKTPEEYAAEQQKRRDDERREVHDRYLLQTYPQTDDLTRARDARLQMLDQQSAGIDKTLKETEDTLADLRSRKVVADADDPDAQNKLANQIASFEATRRETVEAQAKVKIERSETTASFGADLARLQTLRPPPGTDASAGAKGP